MLLVFNMAMLKYVKVAPRKSCSPSILSQKDIKAAQKSIPNAVSVAAEKSQSRGKYNSYSKEQRAMIGKYAAENGPTCAAKHYTAVWGIMINESTARRLKKEYLEKLKEEISENCRRQAEASDTEEHKDEPIVISELETKPRGRPVRLGEQLDSLVQEFLINLRAAGGVVNTTVVMGAAEGIIFSYRDISKLSSHGGHIDITKSWAQSLLRRMGFVKRKCSTSGKITMARFDECKEIFLADVAAEVVINKIPESLGSNWLFHCSNWRLDNGKRRCTNSSNRP